MTDDITVCIPSIPPRAALLRRALSSVQEQTRSADAVAIATDHGRDGAPATRQRALDMARTRWVAFLDDDDVMLPDHLAHLLTHAWETDADYVYSWFYVVAGGVRMEHDPVFPAHHFTDPFNPDNPIQTTITILVKRELAQSVRFVPLEGDSEQRGWSGEDYRFTLGCIGQGAKISHLVKRTWLWHHDSANTSGLPSRW